MTTVKASTDQPAVAATDGATTLCEAFQATAARRGEALALRTPEGVGITWREYAEQVRDLAAGLAAHGIGRGDTVAMMLANRPEGHLVDAAALHLGATPFSVYNTCSTDQIEYVLNHAAARLVVTERAFAERLLAARAGLPALRYVFVVDGAVPGTADLDELRASGDPGFDFEAAWRAVEPHDIATLIYTSGTTGPPKGVELTHENLVWDGAAWLDVTGLSLDGRLMSYLPMAHLADRVCAHYLAMLSGATITCVVDPKAAVPAIAGARPTLWLGVPRVWEKLKAALEAKFAAHPEPEQRAAIARAVEAGVQRVRLEEAGEPVPEPLRAATDRADAAIFAGVREQLGFDEAEFLLSGAAPMPMDVLEFFAAIGLPINEGYGLTECSAVATINREGRRRLGTVGRPLPGVEVMLEPDGELLIRGPLNMRAYRHDPERTAEALDPEGWLHTGDIAQIDGDGFVKIVDRKKEIIINAAGKNMSPANIEAKVKSGSPLIGVVVTIGEARSYNTGLIVLEPDAVRAFATQHGLGDASLVELAADDRVRAEVAAGVERANAQLSRVEQLKKHTIVPGEWLPGGDELTPTMKLKRRPIAAKYTDLIEDMYA